MRLGTVIEIVTDASLEIGIAQQPPSVAVASLDQDVVQMVALLEAVADELLLDEPYRETLGDGNWVIDGVTGDMKAVIGSDEDRIAFDRRLAIDGLKYRFLKAKGLEFGEELRDFSNRLNKLAGIANARVLDLYAEEGRVQ